MLKQSVVAVALTLAGAPFALAQTAPTSAPAALAKKEEPAKADAAQAAAPQKVFVTGSNIRRINIESASPVQIITRDEMTRGGATSLTEVLRTISSNLGGIDENRSGGFTAGASSLNLRGIGGQGTLMLINGRRLAPYAQPEFQSTFVDINSIPVGAVDRIEILKDGASAIYGSEAMAGVVNIILRDSYEGIELGASYGQSQKNDGERKRATLSLGHGSLVQDHFNAYLTVDLRQQQPMLLKNRDAYLGTQNWTEWGYKDNRNLYTYPGNIYWTDKATNTFVSRPIAGAGTCRPDRLVAANTFFGAAAKGSACVFDDIQDSTYNASGMTDRLGLTSRVTWQPNADTTVWAELMYHENRSSVTGVYHWVAGQNGAEVPALPITHPQYPQELIGPDGKTLAGGNGSVRVRAQLADFPGQGLSSRTGFERYLLAAKGTIKSWDWETALLATTSSVEAHSSSAILADPFIDAYRKGTFIFGQAGSNQALIDSITTGAADSFRSGVYQIDGKLSGEVMNLPAGALAVATGVEARHEFLETNPDQQSIDGLLYHTAQSPAGFQNSRQVFSAFGEATVPLFKSLEGQLAVRYDHYSDYGNSTTPKVGLKWNVLPSFLLRGTYAEGFRAPTLVENSTDVRKAFISFKDPERCNAQFKVDCNTSSAYESGANPALGPETSKSFTIGAVWEPATWLLSSIDFWRIKRENEISTYDLTKVLADPARYAGDPAVLIVRDPLSAADAAAGATAGEVTLIRSLLTNVALTDVRGIDLDVRGKFNLGEWGKLDPRLTVTYSKSYKSSPSPTDDPIEYSGTRGAPKFIANLGMVWKKAAWQLSADTSFVGKMAAVDDFTQECVFATEGYEDLCRDIPSFTTVNLGGSYQGFSKFKDLKLSFAVMNAFDRMPPFHPYSSRGVGFYAPLHSAMGRYFQVTLDYKFK